MRAAWEALGPYLFLFYSGVLVFAGWIFGRVYRMSDLKKEWDWGYRDGFQQASAEWKASLRDSHRCNAIPLVPRQEQWNGPEPAGRRPIPPPPDTPIEKLVRVYEKSQEPRRPA